MDPTPSLSARLGPLLLLGFGVGAARFAMEFIKPEYAMYFGLYYVMPVALLVIGIQDKWGRIRWPALAGTMALTALLCWGIFNTLAYTTGQFLEWQHGRFYNGGDDDPGTRAAPIADTTSMKLFWGVAQGLLTAVAGSIWMIVLGTILIWLPGIVRARQKA